MTVLPSELIVHTLGYLPLNKLQNLYADENLRPYVLRLLHRNIVIGCAQFPESEEPENFYSIISNGKGSSFKFKDENDYIRFNSIDLFLRFCSKFENISPDIIEIESIWNLFPLHKLHPDVLTRAKQIRINNPNITHITNANPTFNNCKNVSSFVVNGHANYQCFLQNDDEFLATLLHLGLNNVTFDYKLLHSKLGNVKTLEISDSCSIDDLKQLPNTLKKLYVKLLPKTYKCTDFGDNLQELSIGNVSGQLDFSHLHKLHSLSIHSSQPGPFDITKLSVPPSLRTFSLSGVKVDVARLQHFLQLAHLHLVAIENCNLFGRGQEMEFRDGLQKFTYCGNSCLDVLGNLQFILPASVTQLHVQLVPHYNEVGKVHFKSNTNTSWFYVEDGETGDRSHFMLLDKIEKLSLPLNSLGDHQWLQFPNSVTHLDISSNKLTSLNNTNVHQLCLSELHTSGNYFESGDSRFWF